MYRILLATRSPLYAPIYHAWVTSKPAVKSRLQIDYSHEMSHRDDLVCQTLTNYNGGRPQVLLAVGDVTRLCSYIRKPNGLCPPQIVGGFIDRICLWLVDGDDFDARLNAPENRRILCHPRHMTTYHIASDYMRQSANWGDDDIAARVLPIVPPGLEQQYYAAWKATSFSRIAYMSSEIPRSNKGIVVDFPNLDGYKDASMTGFFTSEHLAGSENDLIAEFLQSVRDSIKRLYTEGDQVPWELYDDRSLPAETGLAQDYEELTELGNSLAAMDAYSTNLALSDGQLKRSLELRAQIEPDSINHFDTLKDFMKGVPSTEEQIVPPSKQLRDLMQVRHDLRSTIYNPLRIGLPHPFDLRKGLFIRGFYLFVSTLIYLGYAQRYTLMSSAGAADPELLWGSLMFVSTSLALITDRRFRIVHATVPPVWTGLTILTVVAAGMLFFEMVPDFMGGKQEWLPGAIISAFVMLYLHRTRIRRRRLWNRAAEILRQSFAIPVALGKRIFTVGKQIGVQLHLVRL